MSQIVKRLVLIVSIAYFWLVSPAGVNGKDTPAYPQSSSPRDTVFFEVNLDENGVAAVDTAGNVWYYDFNAGQFIQGDPPELTEQSTESGPAADELPVEERCTELLEVNPFDRSVWVGYEEYVETDITAINRVTVKGWVKGDVQCLDGRILVTESGQIDGNAEAPEVIVRDGGLVLGEIKLTNPVPKLGDFSLGFSVGGLVIAASFTFVLLLFTFIVISLMPGKVRTIDNCIRSHRVKTGLLGLLLLFFLGPIIGLVAITVVGVLLIPFIPLAYIFAIGLGVVTFGVRIGEVVMRRFGKREQGLLAPAAIGVSSIMAFWLVTAVLLGTGDSTANGFGIALLVISIIISTYPTLTGIGGALLTRFGNREHRPRRFQSMPQGISGAPAPAPPPIPNGPTGQNN